MRPGRRGELIAMGVVLVILEITLLTMPKLGSGDAQAGTNPQAEAAASPTATPSAERQPDYKLVMEPGLTVPAGARLATPDQAVAAAEWLSQMAGGRNPQIAEVRLTRLRQALEEAAMGMFGRDPDSPVWVVTLTGQTFYVPHCPPNEDGRCPELSHLEIVFHAENGDKIAMFGG